VSQSTVSCEHLAIVAHLLLVIFPSKPFSSLLRILKVQIKQSIIMKNIHNLSRTIPQRIKDQIRRESGYACVVCGSCPYHYEHIQPEFKDASSHDPEKMTLLCPLCHQKVTNKVFSKDLVWQAKKEPWAIKNGHTKYGLDFFGDEFKFVLGNF
jgi:hypothetical protein